MPLAPQQIQLAQQYRQEIREVRRRVARKELPFEVSAPVALILENEPIKNCVVLSIEYRAKTVRMLVHQALLQYVKDAKEGEDDPEDADDAMDVISEFDKCVKKYEMELMKNGKTCIQQAYFTTLARNAYAVYCINKLVKRNDDNNEPEFDKETIDSLDLNDDFVASKVKEMAALKLGKSCEKLIAYSPKKVLKYIGPEQKNVEKITEQEFRKITYMKYQNYDFTNTKTMRCLGDSHYYLKPEFENNPDWDYDLRTMIKTRINDIDTREAAVALESKICEIDQEIEKYRLKKHKKENKNQIGPHDTQLRHMYSNIAHIYGENPNLAFDVNPSGKV